MREMLVNYVILILSLLVNIIILTHLIRKKLYKNVPSMRIFIFYLFTQFIYIFIYFVLLNSKSYNFSLLLFKLLVISAIITTYSWTIFGFKYVVKWKSNTLATVILFIFLCISISIVILLTNKIHNLCIVGFEWEFTQENIAVFSVKLGKYFRYIVNLQIILSFINMALYFRGFLKGTKIHRNIFGIVFYASLLKTLILTYTLYSTEISSDSLFVVNLVILIMNSLYLYGMLRFKMFDTVLLAYDLVFDYTDEAFILFDKTGRVIDFNNLVTYIYPETHISTKMTLDSFISAHSELSDIQNEIIVQYMLNIDQKEKYYYAKIDIIFYNDEIPIGKLLKICDITEYKEFNNRMEAAANIARSEAEANEISFLQAQIKPHFLYNTLSVISSLMFSKPDSAKELIVDLSDLLRESYFFDNSTEFVLIKDEIRTIKTYVRIEKARFKDRVNFQFAFEKIPDIYIPRLIIQPLVENAIKHGLTKKEGGVNIKLNLFEKENEICVEVTDDGLGIEPENIPKILTRNDDEHGIGLANIDKRLKKHYGKGLIIISQIGEGTSVSFNIPNNLLQAYGG